MSDIAKIILVFAKGGAVVITVGTVVTVPLWVFGTMGLIALDANAPGVFFQPSSDCATVQVCRAPEHDPGELPESWKCDDEGVLSGALATLKCEKGTEGRTISRNRNGQFIFTGVPLGYDCEVALTGVSGTLPVKRGDNYKCAATETPILCRGTWDGGLKKFADPATRIREEQEPTTERRRREKASLIGECSGFHDLSYGIKEGCAEVEFQVEKQAAAFEACDKLGSSGKHASHKRVLLGWTLKAGHVSDVKKTGWEGANEASERVTACYAHIVEGLTFDSAINGDVSYRWDPNWGPKADTVVVAGDDKPAQSEAAKAVVVVD